MKLHRTDIFLLIAFFGIATVVRLFDGKYDGDTFLHFIDIVQYIATSTLSVYVIVFILFAKFFPTKRYVILILSILSFVFVMGFISINHWCFWRECEFNPLSGEMLYQAFIVHVEEIGLLITLVIGKKLYDAQLHFSQVEKEKKESELRWLNAQMDPHFLFNNLNTVDALIDSDPQQAKKYLNKLSGLYRYLIYSKDQEVVLLQEELEFAKDYIYLLNSRYGEAYQFDIQYAETQIDNYWVPPGALQTLLENIVKHNKASDGRIVHSSIVVQKGSIKVSNDLRKKKPHVESTGIGLNNLRARYKLLTDLDIKVSSNGRFSVELPLIQHV